MDYFKNLFGFSKSKKSKVRTLQNFNDGVKSGYLQYFSMAQNFYKNNKLAESYELVNKAIDVSDVEDWQPHALKGCILEDWGKFSEAITAYSKGIEYASDDYDVYALYHQIGFCYLSLGNDLKAEEFYTVAINLKNQHPNSEFYLDEEGYDGGIVRGLPYERLYNNRGNALKNLGKLNEALSDCEKAIQYNPNYSNPYLLAAQILDLAGRKEHAIQVLIKAAQLGNSEAGRILRNLGIQP